MEAPGKDGVHGYWLKKLTNIRDSSRQLSANGR